MNGIDLISKEREEQIVKHGRSIANDALHNDEGELRQAAFGLICNNGQGSILKIPKLWDRKIYTKMLQKSYKNRLIIAGALIAAEIDRLEYIQELKEVSVPDDDLPF